MEVIFQLSEKAEEVESTSVGYYFLVKIATSLFGLIMNSPTELGIRLPYQIVEE
jgi:hypothetical protein